MQEHDFIKEELYKLLDQLFKYEENISEDIIAFIIILNIKNIT